MHTTRRDDIVRALGDTPTRRHVSRAMAGLAAGSFLAPLVRLSEVEAKKKKKKKKKKNKDQDQMDELPPLPASKCAAGETGCGFLCCPPTQSSCCGAETDDPLCYDAATESCCPDVGGRLPSVACPAGTRCEYYRNPTVEPSIGIHTFCCPAGSTKCENGCCPAGTVCCPATSGDGAGECCPDSAACDPASGVICLGNDYVDPRIV